jgi:hypothetical protein
MNIISSSISITDNEIIDENIQKSIDNVINIFNIYKNNSYMKNKIHNYISNLNNVMQKILVEKEERDKQREKMNKEKCSFNGLFLQTHNYSYCHNTEYFFNYDGLHYNIYNEDDIQHEILTSITDGRILMSMKHRIKMNILKQIKEIYPLIYTPEPETIQFVIDNLYPFLFNSKDSAIYFLNIIGDSILKKNENIIYIISASAKGICREIMSYAYNLLGITHIFNCIKYKYYEHNLSDCRLIKINFSNKKLVLAKSFYKYILDFFLVACHYSKININADTFLETCDTTLIRHALFLKENSIDDIIDNFIDTTLEKCSGTSINWKNMLYLWKFFLDKKIIPNMIFNAKLKLLLAQKLEYIEHSDSYFNITSKLLPVISNFIKFWDETMVKDEDEIFIEIDEINNLFKHWSGKSSTLITDDILIDLIQHFYNDIIIDEYKYIQQISCKLWDKKNDIIISLEEYKIYKNNNTNNTDSSIYNIYKYYCDFYSHKQFIVSKQYFDKFIIDYIKPEFIDEYGFILPSWWNCE